MDSIGRRAHARLWYPCHGITPILLRISPLHTCQIHLLQLKGKGCSACGMKATEQWIVEQQHILPDCEWQHITFTMPDKLWPLFANNWPLLNLLFSCAANILLRWPKTRCRNWSVCCPPHLWTQLNRHPRTVAGYVLNTASGGQFTSKRR